MRAPPDEDGEGETNAGSAATFIYVMKPSRFGDRHRPSTRLIQRFVLGDTNASQMGCANAKQMAQPKGAKPTVRMRRSRNSVKCATRDILESSTGSAFGNSASLTTRPLHFSADQGKEGIERGWGFRVRQRRASSMRARLITSFAEFFSHFRLCTVGFDHKRFSQLIAGSVSFPYCRPNQRTTVERSGPTTTMATTSTTMISVSRGLAQKLPRRILLQRSSVRESEISCSLNVSTFWI